jgi:hypothetical protein
MEDLVWFLHSNGLLLAHHLARPISELPHREAGSTSARDGATLLRGAAPKHPSGQPCGAERLPVNDPDCEQAGFAEALLRRLRSTFADKARLDAMQREWRA